MLSESMNKTSHFTSKNHRSGEMLEGGLWPYTAARCKSQLWKRAISDDDMLGCIGKYIIDARAAAGLKDHAVVTVPAIWNNQALTVMDGALARSIIEWQAAVDLGDD